MDLFNMRLSKKTSEAGVWIPDEEVLGCMQCKGKFSLLNRKHHCRQCGSIVCGKCSTQRKFMESSRTGTPKRVCDTCFNSDRKPEPEDDEEDEPPTGKMDNLRVSGSGASAPAPAAARAASTRNLSVKLPEISMEEAVEALRNHPFEGKWKFVLTFLVVDIGPNRGADAVVSGLQVGSFKSAAAINAGGKRGTLTKDGHVRTGSRVQLWLTLKPKGAAYFQGECSEFGQFGKDGKVTGALQRTVGKINMTIQMVNHKTTTSFNFVGNMDRKGTFCGTFSGCEISKNAGSVSGAFTAVRDDSGGEDGDGAGAGDAGEADGSDDGGGLEDGGDDSEDEAPKKSISKGSSKGKGSRRKGGDSDSD